MVIIISGERLVSLTPCLMQDELRYDCVVSLEIRGKMDEPLEPWEAAIHPINYEFRYLRIKDYPQSVMEKITRIKF